jgi:hypothetical protein
LELGHSLLQLDTFIGQTTDVSFRFLQLALQPFDLGSLVNESHTRISKWKTYLVFPLLNEQP